MIKEDLLARPSLKIDISCWRSFINGKFNKLCSSIRIHKIKKSRQFKKSIISKYSIKILDKINNCFRSSEQARKIKVVVKDTLFLVEEGLEPPALGLWSQCSNQLNYTTLKFNVLPDFKEHFFLTTDEKLIDLFFYLC